MNKKILKLILAAALSLSLFSAAQNTSAMEEKSQNNNQNNNPVNINNIKSTNNNNSSKGLVCDNTANFKLRDLLDEVKKRFDFLYMDITIDEFTKTFLYFLTSYFENNVKNVENETQRNALKSKLSEKITRDIYNDMVDNKDIFAFAEKNIAKNINKPVKQIFNNANFKKQCYHLIKKYNNIFNEKTKLSILSKTQIDFLDLVYLDKDKDKDKDKYSDKNSTGSNFSAEPAQNSNIFSFQIADLKANIIFYSDPLWNTDQNSHSIKEHISSIVDVIGNLYVRILIDEEKHNKNSILNFAKEFKEYISKKLSDISIKNSNISEELLNALKKAALKRYRFYYALLIEFDEKLKENAKPSALSDEQTKYFKKIILNNENLNNKNISDYSFEKALESLAK